MTVLAEFARRLAPPPAPVGAATAGCMERGVAILRELGPYAAIELILPGGSILVVLLWLCRRHQRLASVKDFLVSAFVGVMTFLYTAYQYSTIYAQGGYAPKALEWL
jgi:hypothetical protein